MKQTMLPPTLFRNLRIAGETQIHPPEVTKTEIMRSGKTKVVATFRMCIGTDAQLTQLSLAKSSGFPAYDAELTTGLRGWKFKPYMLEHSCGDKPEAVPVCGMVTFIYGMQ